MIDSPRAMLFCISTIALPWTFSNSAVAQGAATDKAPMAQNTGQVTTKIIAENAKLTVSDVLYRPGDTGSVSSKDGIVVYIVHGGTIERTFADGSKQVATHKTGETLLIAEKRPYSTKISAKLQYMRLS